MNGKETPSKELPKSLEELWDEHPDIIRRFLEQRPNYKQLCEEVAYILKKKIDSSSIKISEVTWRAKTLQSFFGKIQRKHYEDPFSEITDFGGIRVVCLYKSDIDKIEQVIRSEFQVIPDDEIDRKDNKFGYRAKHFIVKLRRELVGSRYDDLKDLVCEIQVRTVADDAWAIIDHHLEYKQESEIPASLKKSMEAISFVLNLLDDEFEKIRQEKEKHLEEIKRQREEQETVEFLKNELNIDSFREFLIWRFNNIHLESSQGAVETLFEELDKDKYKKLADLNLIADQTESVRSKVTEKLISEGRLNNSAANAMAISLAIADQSFRTKVPELWRELIENE